MKPKISLGVIFGGRSGEHEVSLMSARSVLSILAHKKYNVTQIGIDHEGKWWSGENTLAALEKRSSENLVRVFLLPEPGKTVLFKREKINAVESIQSLQELDVIFPVLHGTFGEDGTLQGFFEMADIAYVGAGVLGSSVGMDKSVFKDVMRSNGIPVVDWITCTRKDVENKIETTPISTGAGSTVTEPVQKLSYKELRDRLPQEITDDVVNLLANSEEALQEFAYIRTQEDVNGFNVKYGVNLVIPPVQG